MGLFSENLKLEAINDASQGKMTGRQVRATRPVIVFDVTNQDQRYKLDSEDVLTVEKWDGRDLFLSIDGMKVVTSDVNGFEYV